MSTESITDNKEIIIEWQDKLFERSIRRTRKLKRLEKQLGYTEHLRCLEISAGDGVISRHLKKSNKNWSTAVISKKALDSVLVSTDIEPIQLLSEMLPFEDNQFDIVVMMDTVKVFFDTPKLIHECHRVLKTEGQVIITDTCPTSLTGVIQTILRTSPKANGLIRNGFTPKQLFNELKSGFDIPETNLFNNAIFVFFCSFSDWLQKILFRGPCWMVRKNYSAMDINLYKFFYFIRCLTYPIMWILAQLEFFPSTQLLVKSKRRIWRERKQPVIKDGRTIAEAAINTKIGTDAPF